MKNGCFLKGGWAIIAQYYFPIFLARPLFLQTILAQFLMDTCKNSSGLKALK
jgi:hypothetical protein